MDSALSRLASAGLKHRRTRADACLGLMHHRARGQTVLEFGLVAMLFIMLLFGIFDFGFMLNDWLSVTAGASLGARQAAIGACLDGPCAAGEMSVVAAVMTSPPVLAVSPIAADIAFVDLQGPVAFCRHAIRNSDGTLTVTTIGATWQPQGVACSASGSPVPVLNDEITVLVQATVHIPVPLLGLPALRRSLPAMRRVITRRQPAQTLVITALSMLALIGVLALVADVGLMWEAQRELQKTGDSAALAGIILLPGDPNGAVQSAQTYAQKNQGIAAAFCSAPPTTTATPGQHDFGGGTVYTLTVTMQCTAGFTFARVVNGQQDGNGHGGFNLNTIPNTVDSCGCLRASGTAVLGSLAVAGCPVPFAVTDANEGVTVNGTPIFDGDPGATWMDMARNGSGYAFGQLVPLHVDNAASSFGNFHAIQFGNQSGAGAYEANLSGHCVANLAIQAGDQITTEPGDMTGPTQHGLDLRGLVSCSGATAPDLCNSNYPTAHANFDLACPDDPFDHNGHIGVLNSDGSVKGSSPCLATAMVVTPQSFTTCNGRCQITVEGFARFFLAGWDQSNKQVWGIFVSDSPTLGEVGAYNPLGTVVTRLIR